MPNKPLKVNQAIGFYNYVLGFDSAKIDLLKTGINFLEAGVSTSVFFSDFKYMYLDKSGKRYIEMFERKDRGFDSNKILESSAAIPKHLTSELWHSCQMGLHEDGIQNEVTAYIRVCLPPIRLQNDGHQISLFASVKIYSDGIAILSFRLDADSDGLDEQRFVSDIVNIYKYNFKSIWVDSNLQKLDAKVVLDTKSEDFISNNSNYLTNWKIKRLIQKTKRETKKHLDDALQVEGNSFNFGEVDWDLHQIVGTENDDSGGLTVDLCRSMYSNAISSLLVSEKSERKTSLGRFMWQGRPSIALLRFEEQPETKEELFNNFSHSISNIIHRVDNTVKFFELPPDLRALDDYCLHGNRAILLWTWLKPKKGSKSVQDDTNKYSSVLENQVRSEHIEYYNLKVARACTWAQKPFSNDHLLYAYEVLANSESMLHQSGKSGEIIDTLTYLMEKSGTTGLVNSSKESARFHLDELRYKSDKAKSRGDSMLTFVFGLVGAASLAQFAVHPFVQEVWPRLSKTWGPIVSFGFSGGLIISIATILWFINDKKS
jgi:hypothetical protein